MTQITAGAPDGNSTPSAGQCSWLNGASLSNRFSIKCQRHLRRVGNNTCLKNQGLLPPRLHLLHVVLWTLWREVASTNGNKWHNPKLSLVSTHSSLCILAKAHAPAGTASLLFGATQQPHNELSAPRFLSKRLETPRFRLALAVGRARPSTFSRKNYYCAQTDRPSTLLNAWHKSQRRRRCLRPATAVHIKFLKNALRTVVVSGPASQLSAAAQKPADPADATEKHT